MREPEKSLAYYQQAMVVNLGEALGLQWPSVDMGLGSLVVCSYISFHDRTL